MHDPLDRFSSEYQDYHGMSEGRRREQLVVLREFRDHAGGDLLAATADHLRSYLAGKIANGQHPNTVARKNKMIRPFYQWAFDVRLIDGDTLMRMRGVPHPKGSSNRGTPRPYSAKELQSWREALDSRWPMVNPKWWPRVAKGSSRYKRVASEVMRTQIECVVALALHGGLRRREIFHLSLDDMHPDNAYVVVRQRARVANGKDHLREVPFTEGLREAVTRWLAMRERIGVTHDSPWIVAVANVPDGVWLQPMRFARFAELLTTVGRWELHRFRHTSATNWLRAGVPIELVSRYLGHATIQQTLVYAELVREDIQTAVERNEARFTRLIGEEVPDAA